MRFLFLTQYFPPEIGGPQTRLQSMASQLMRAGHEVEVVTSIPNYPQGKFFAGYGGKFYVREMREGVVVHRVWLYPSMGGGIGRMLNYATFSLTSIFGLIKARKPDYLIVESPPLTCSIPAYLASWVWGIPYIFNVADLWPDAVVDTGFLKKGIVFHLLLALEKWSYKQAAFVNAVTDGIREALLFRKGVPPEKVLFLPNGADTVQYQPRTPDKELKKRLNLDGKKIILWAGTLGHAHGLDSVLRASKLLSTREEIHFLFLGDGSARKSLENLARELRLTNVTFLAPVSIEELPPYYAMADCGLASLRSAPTHDGARPSKIFPVLASGKPLIFVGQGECARLVEDANAGIVIPPENPQALAEGIVELFERPQLLESYGANGRRYVEENFDWSKLVASWVSRVVGSNGDSIALGKLTSQLEK